MPSIKLWLTAALIASLTGCTGDQKIWVVVSIKKPNGQLTHVGFADPTLGDKDLTMCILSMKGAAAGLMEEIDGMPDLKGSHFLAATCVQSDKNPYPDRT